MLLYIIFFGNSVHIAYFCNRIMKNKADTTISKRFALIGLAGYIAPRHLKAIQELDHNLWPLMTYSTVLE